MTGYPPSLIAHRGWPSRWPENTLEGIRAALQAGASRIEVDIQLSRDAVPLLLHDEDLVRTAGVDVSIFSCTLEQLRQIDIGQQDRFGTRYAGTRIPTLAGLVRLMHEWPTVEVFIELKRASLVRCGRKRVLDAVTAVIAPVRDRCILISFDARVIKMVRQRNFCRTGWAVRAMNRRNHDRAFRLAPDYLFCNTRLMPPAGQDLWNGPWQWVVYTVNDPLLALQLGQRGVRLIETDAIGEMLRDSLMGHQEQEHA